MILNAAAAAGEQLFSGGKNPGCQEKLAILFCFVIILVTVAVTAAVGGTACYKLPTSQRLVVNMLLLVLIGFTRTSIPSTYSTTVLHFSLVCVLFVCFQT